MAKANQVVSVLKPTKGVRPNFGGVPGALVSLEGVTGLEFGRTKISPYDALLDQLAKATDEAVEKQQPRPGLKFGDARAKASVYARAKQKGLRVLFAIAGKDLYVRMEGRVDDNIKGARREAIRKILAKGEAFSYIQITNKLRADGDLTIDAPIVDAILLQMMRAGEVARQETGAWRAAPAARKVS